MYEYAFIANMCSLCKYVLLLAHLCFCLRACLFVCKPLLFLFTTAEAAGCCYVGSSRVALLLRFRRRLLVSWHQTKMSYAALHNFCWLCFIVHLDVTFAVRARVDGRGVVQLQNTLNYGQSKSCATFFIFPLVDAIE